MLKITDESGKTKFVLEDEETEPEEVEDKKKKKETDKKEVEDTN